MPQTLRQFQLPSDSILENLIHTHLLLALTPKHHPQVEKLRIGLTTFARLVWGSEHWRTEVRRVQMTWVQPLVTAKGVRTAPDGEQAMQTSARQRLYCEAFQQAGEGAVYFLLALETLKKKVVEPLEESDAELAAVVVGVMRAAEGKEEAPEVKKGEGKGDADMGCYCETGQAGAPMLKCGTCTGMFHYRCMGLKEILKDESSWLCPVCDYCKYFVVDAESEASTVVSEEGRK